MEYRSTLAAILLLWASAASAQQWQIGSRAFAPINSFTPITVEATCTGTGTVNPIGCSSAMTVSAGDVIVCSGSASSFDPVSLTFDDPVNGPYDTGIGTTHPNATSTTWVATGIFQNSQAGTFTPYVNNWEAPNSMNIKCRALKGARVSGALDGGSVQQTNVASTASANPTSGTAAAPTNANEFVYGAMVRPTASATSDASPWVPGTTITAVGSTYPIYDHYQIQTTATSANSPMTSASAKYVDTQLAVLNASSPAGYRSIAGLYGVPAIAKTNGATASVADLNGATTTLSTLNGNPGWSQYVGSATTYDTSVAPTGTGKILADGVAHTFGDAGTSIKFSNTGASATGYEWDDNYKNHGEPMWFSYFLRTASSGTSDGQECDNTLVGYGVTIPTLTWQIQYSSANGLGAFFEDNLNNNKSPIVYFGGTLDTDYWYQIHIAGANERYHQWLAYGKSGGVWSLISTANYDVMCTANTNILPCTGTSGSNPIPTVASGTGSASSGSTTLTISSLASGTISAGKVVIATGIPWLTAVQSVTGTGPYTVTLTQPTTAAVSGTINFFGQPAGNSGLGGTDSITNGTATAGSTALTVTTPSAGTIAVGDAVGGYAGIAQGTVVSAVSGTSVTLSQPVSATISGTGVWFWKPATQGRQIIFGKWSSCNLGGTQWYSGLLYDPLGAWGAYAPN